jgi:hypothetical protein
MKKRSCLDGDCLRHQRRHHATGTLLSLVKAAGCVVVVINVFSAC